MSAAEFVVRTKTGDWHSAWDPAEGTLVRPTASLPVAASRESGGIRLEAPDYQQGRRIFRVVLDVPILSTNALYRTTWVPSGKAVAKPVPKRVYQVTESGMFLPVRALRVRTTEHKTWKKDVVRQLSASSDAVPHCIPAGVECYVRIWVHGAWYTKAKKIRRQDLGNCEKALLDTIFEYVKVDDSVVFVLWMGKLKDDLPAFTVEIGTLVPRAPS